MSTNIWYRTVCVIMKEVIPPKFIERVRFDMECPISCIFLHSDDD